MFSARVGKKQLSGLCRRLATSLEAGLDIRGIMDREAGIRGGGPMRSRLREVREQISQGVSMGEAVKSTGDFFPPLFREMIAVGEATGKQAEVFRHLADHYDHQIQVRRVFLIALAWPAFQLGVAILAIAAMIWMLGWIAARNNGEVFDMLGLGLIGTPGLIKYFGFLAVVFGFFFLVYHAIRQGWLWGRIVERVLLYIPFVGGALRALAMERLAWALNLTLDTDMSTTKAIGLSLRSTQNGVYADAEPDIVRDVMSGRSLTEAFERTHVFPDDFLETLEIGERSGRIPESMRHLAKQYQDKGRLAIRALTAVGWFIMLALMMGIIITMIFRMALSYTDLINDMANPNAR
jgi:type II secretory pathway component PulF